MTETTTSRLPLLDVFPPSTPADWRAAAEAMLKGAPFEKVMRTKTLEGFTMEPIYHRETLDGLPQSRTLPGFDGFLRGTRAAAYTASPWEVAQELPYGDGPTFNAALRADLMRGQTALNLTFDVATLRGMDPDAAKVGEVGACGLSVASLGDLLEALAGVVPDALGCHLQSGASGLALGGMFLAWLGQVGADAAAVKGSLNADPLGQLAAEGHSPVAVEALFDELADLAAGCAAVAPGLAAVGVSTLPYHLAGASAVEELALALATAVTYLRALAERGLPVEVAARQIRFSLVVGPDFFLEIAKIRAARMLWAQIVAAFGGSPEAQKIKLHARTGLLNKTRLDPYVNMLRTSTEALSAAVAGVDSLHVGAFDEVIGEPDTFSRRIARNTQIILQEECDLTAVADPAGGSWAVEALTDAMAQRTWEIFQQVERDGGLLAVLSSGGLATILGQPAAERLKRFQQRRLSLVGTNVYPNPDEQPLTPRVPDYAAVGQARAAAVRHFREGRSPEAARAVAAALHALAESAHGARRLQSVAVAFTAGATLGEVTGVLRRGQGAGLRLAPLPSSRLAAGYEAMRSACQRFAAKHGSAPKIYLACIGPLAKHKPRADFTTAFFAAGGFSIHQADGVSEAAVAARQAHESGAPMVVICGTDEAYVDFVPACCQALRGLGSTAKIILAGNPGEHEAAYRAAGLDDAISIKSDHYATNLRFLKGLGVL